MTDPSSKEIRQLRAVAHNLNPVVTIAGNGLSENVITELNRALHDHELIKVKVVVGDREQRDSVIAELCETTGARLVQRIGNVAIILRRSLQPDPKKSNLLRKG